MERWNISEDIKQEVLSLVKDIDYDLRIIFILKNFGPQRFSDLEKNCLISRSTLSKYLKILIEKKFIEKKIYNDNTPRYFITELGIEKLSEEPFEKGKRIYFTELNSQISRLSDLLNYYKKIGIENSIIVQIVKMISKIGENYYIIDQTQELFLAIFYMFLNSVFTPDFKFEINEFCIHYKVKKLRIDYYIDKIMSSRFGFYMFTRDNDIFFFHEEDIIGTSTLRLIKDRLIEEIIHINQRGYRKIYDLDKIAENIAKKLIAMKIIWDRIKEPFEMLIEKMLIKVALEMGFSKPFLMDIVLQSEKLSKSKEGVNSLINIIEGSESYEDLNVVSIEEIKETSLEEILVQIQGFCNNCGKTILKNDLLGICSKCGNNYHSEGLTTDIDAASKASIQFKQVTLQEEVLIECPNPNCNYHVKTNWDICPECSTPIKK